MGPSHQPTGSRSLRLAVALAFQVCSVFDHGPLSALTQFRYIERVIGGMPPPFPDTTFPSIQILCKAIIGQFSASNLRLSTEGKKITTAGVIRPVESQYQDEFYRAFSSLLPGITLSSEWARAGNGRIDFWVAAKNWGIELLRDHDRVEEHSGRFKKGGRYHRWVEEGLLQEWLIIDCATSPAGII